MDKEIEEDNFDIRFLKIGSGNRVLFSFHGYGLDGFSWQPLDPVLSEVYTIYHIHLPFHQNSVLEINEHQHFAQVFQKFLELRNIHQHKIDLISFSLGSNYVLHLIENMPEKIGRVLMLAPDGFKKIDLRRLLNGTSIGRRIRSRFISKPGFFYTILKIAKALNFINKNVYEYYRTNIDKQEDRKNLMYRWAAVFHLKVNLNKVYTNIAKHKIDCNIIAGEKDTVIRLSEFRKLRNKPISVQTVNMGHMMMVPKLRPMLEDWIKSDPLLRNNE
ncbi:alpha/beta hydrolase [bacterium]|nr:alpha/beta hydrolase [bacterium]